MKLRQGYHLKSTLPVQRLRLFTFREDNLGLRRLLLPFFFKVPFSGADRFFAVSFLFNCFLSSRNFPKNHKCSNELHEWKIGKIILSFHPRLSSWIRKNKNQEFGFQSKRQVRKKPHTLLYMTRNSYIVTYWLREIQA